MAGIELKPGDKVIYRDRDEVRWGPWEVSDVSGDMVTVIVEELITCAASADLLEKIEQKKELV